jgi:hypothetical protein
MPQAHIWLVSSARRLQPVYRLGWHVDLSSAGPNKNGCGTAVLELAAYPDPTLAACSSWRCAETGGRLWRNASKTPTELCVW